MTMKRRLASAALLIMLGLTQWLISQGIYDPAAPGGKPTQTATQPTSCK